jgi:hypothetical protein
MVSGRGVEVVRALCLHNIVAVLIALGAGSCCGRSRVSSMKNSKPPKRLALLDAMRAGRKMFSFEATEGRSAALIRTHPSSMNPRLGAEVYGTFAGQEQNRALLLQKQPGRVGWIRMPKSLVLESADGACKMKRRGGIQEGLHAITAKAAESSARRVANSRKSEMAAYAVVLRLGTNLESSRAAKN